MWLGELKVTDKDEPTNKALLDYNLITLDNLWTDYFDSNASGKVSRIQYEAGYNANMFAAMSVFYR